MTFPEPAETAVVPEEAPTTEAAAPALHEVPAPAPVTGLKAFDAMEHHPAAEHLVKILCERTQNNTPLLFRVMVAYYFSVVASMMRAQVESDDRGRLPVNLYAFNLAASGAGKGRSINVLEDEVIDQFRHNFKEQTLPIMASQELPKLANNRAARKGTDPDDELDLVEGEYKALGEAFFSFDSATEAALKDERHRCLMTNIGALNLQIDEIGLNLTSSVEALTTYLELYDVGKLKGSLRKNTNDNKRRMEIDGRTPANMLAFGSPSIMLDGGKIEEQFVALNETGYARRCFFSYLPQHKASTDKTPEEIWQQRVAGNSDAFLEQISDRLGDLADPSQANRIIPMPKSVALLFIEYEQHCHQLANQMPTHMDLLSAEMRHRYFKALKLAGAYAFIDSSVEVTEDHAYAAIKLTEESGKAFEQICFRDPNYVKLANYLADINGQVSQSDLVANLPFYKGSAASRAEMMQLAISHGYRNNIIIKKQFVDGIEFITGESLKKTTLNDMIFTYSTEMAHNYVKEDVPVAFDDLWKLTQAPNIHWCNHAFEGGHRMEDKAVPGFNMLVLDIDDGVNLATAKNLLRDYKALFYTTRNHQIAKNGVTCDRYRILLPINYTLNLSAKDYKEFMKNIFDWLPFQVDEQTNQRARKWLSQPGQYEYQDGEILDILPFIPKTTKNEEFRSRVLDQQGMDNLERWVINNTGSGNRNNMLIRYAMILVDAGYDFDGVRSRVTSLNDKMADKLDEAEILGTVMVTVSKAIAKKQP